MHARLPPDPAAIEARLFLRDLPIAALPSRCPTLILVVLGADPRAPGADPTSAGQPSSTTSLPSLLAVTLAMVGVTQRCPRCWPPTGERGVLRRLRDHPGATRRAAGRPTACIGPGAAILAARAADPGRPAGFGVPLPRHLLGFLLAFVLGGGGARARAAGRGGGAERQGGDRLGTVPFFRCMFFAGVYLPRVPAPDACSRIGDSRRPGCRRCATPGPAPRSRCTWS